MTKKEKEERKKRVKEFNDWVSITSIKYPDMQSHTGNDGIHWQITVGQVRFDIWPSTWYCTKTTPVGKTPINSEPNIKTSLEKELCLLEAYDEL